MNLWARMEVEFNKMDEQHASRCVLPSQHRVYRGMSEALNAQGDRLHTLAKKDQNLT